MVILFFFAGLLLVVWGSDIFIDVAVRLAKRLHISEMLIGATLVSMGTTLPELLVSSTAAFQGHCDMAAGNAIGSVICNTALIAGLTQVIRPSNVDPASFRRPALQFLFAALVFCLLAYTQKAIGRPGAILLLALLAAHMMGAYQQAKRGRAQTGADEAKGSLPMDICFLAVTAGMLFWGAQLLIDNGVLLAQQIGIPEHVISISLIAFGTSLPELLTALTALRKKHAAISLGNVIGANILNLLMVLGTAGAISPISLSNCMLQVDIPVMLLVSAILLIPALACRRLFRWQGAALLAVFVTYMIYIYIR